MESIDAAEKRVRAKIMQMAVKIDADGHVAPAKVILSKRACEPFLVVFCGSFSSPVDGVETSGMQAP